MNAHEEITGLGAKRTAIAEGDEGIGGPGHLDPHALALELVAQQQPHREGNLLLSRPPRKEDAGISRIYSAVARIDGDDVAGPQSVGKRVISFGWCRSAGDRRTARGTGVDQAGSPPIVPIAIAQRRKAAPRRQTEMAGTACRGRWRRLRRAAGAGY